MGRKPGSLGSLLGLIPLGVSLIAVLWLASMQGSRDSESQAKASGAAATEGSLLSRKHAGPGFMRLSMLLAASLVASLLIIAPPQARTVDSEVRAASETVETQGDDPGAAVVEATEAMSEESADTLGLEGGADSPSTTPATPWVPARWTTATLNVHIGPSPHYAVVGLLPRGTRLQIVGRDTSGDWLAIVFSPGSKLTGWIEASKVSGLTDVNDLEVAPITPLQVPTPAPAPSPTRTPPRRR